MQIKAFLSLPSCHLHEASLTPQCRQQTQATSPTPGAAIFSVPSSPTPAGGEEAAEGRKEERHLETGRPGTWERVRSPRSPGGGGDGPWEGLAEVGEPGWSGEDRAPALPCYGASSERKQAGGQDVLGQMRRGEGSCTQLGLQGGGVGGWVRERWQQRQSQGVKAL